ncbi:phospho-N-acetylmuramoyl-pentapeptide-transferase [Bacteroidia bacterium]|jgi:phospho-N-acetylmuramoyl-pentapeptide-transferase|nr:phospho-N-acetylmuramoyl-pentapeptide-transferase [Bacteroidia bacterium]MDB3868927.1 phospho-N-acetylmuramoyl-pentapeptide-transferase [Bacteroidia bacterium]MDC3407317.1 phospho-N-acetylmuramoyl-pentapeptide-transferase [Bacteroidia bacterium]
MLYHLFEYLEETYQLPGAGVFQYISFRASLAVIVSLIISLLFGKRLIDKLRDLQAAETIRTLGLDGEEAKRGTPTMGGLIILAAILIPTLLFAKLDNVYVLLMIFSTIWLGLIGFLDDYIKIYKKDKAGLAGRFKVIGQVGLGIIVALVLHFNDNVVVREQYKINAVSEAPADVDVKNINGQLMYFKDVKSSATTLPFIKEHEVDYSKFLFWMSDAKANKWAWVVFMFIAVLVITAVSNGANLTDGIDGLAAGSSAIIGITLAVLAFVSGNLIFSDYLNIMFIPNQGELVIFAAAFTGACIGFLWYNSFPAQVFMGDTGSLALGGIIAVLALMIRKELVLPILCGIFLIENLSVMLQVSYFKYTKKKYGEGKRIFKMSPLHHHYQKLGYAEPKIVTRFWIVGIMLAIFTIITFKLR